MNSPSRPARFRRPHWSTALIILCCLPLGLDLDVLVDGPPTGEDWWALAVNTVVTFSLLWRRSHPWWVLAVIVAGDVLTAQTQVVVYAVAVYSLAAHRSLAAVTAGAAGSLAVLGAELFLRGGRDEIAYLGLYGLAVIGAVLIGANVAIRRQYVRALVDRAAQLAHEKEQEGRLAAARERARIAHDLHDIVAHNLTVMVRLADGATAVADADPQRSRRAVQRAADLGREAMKDMRRLLGVLHDGSDDVVGDLDTLVETFRIAGLPVTLRRRGADPTSPGLQRVVFRVVQEALTNALRYAEHPTEVLADLDYTGPIRIVVTDDGRGTGPAPSVGSEQGLNAMRERAALYGGTVESGPQTVGWAVRVTLPHPTEETDD
ncbi:sensor histidine kinase [Actinoplanes sp. G11-F43]|uniref:sensor histidine kinase n=1 Tax=Actinoplanes sp. G11-F43 TaxID=3424130 RepID=UPI003D33EA77